MKNFCLALFLLLAPGGADVRSERENAGQGASGVKDVMSRFFEYAKRQNWDAVGALMASDFEIYTDQAESYGKDDYIRLLKSDNLEMKRMDLHDERVAVSRDGTLAWMTYKGYFENVEKGKPTKVETAETMLFRRQAGKWVLARGHASIHDVGGK